MAKSKAKGLTKAAKEAAAKRDAEERSTQQCETNHEETKLQEAKAEPPTSGMEEKAKEQTPSSMEASETNPIPIKMEAVEAVADEVKNNQDVQQVGQSANRQDQATSEIFTTPVKGQRILRNTKGFSETLKTLRESAGKEPPTEEEIKFVNDPRISNRIKGERFPELLEVGLQLRDNVFSNEINDAEFIEACEESRRLSDANTHALNSYKANRGSLTYDSDEDMPPDLCESSDESEESEVEMHSRPAARKASSKGASETKGKATSADAKMSFIEKAQREAREIRPSDILRAMG